MKWNGSPSNFNIPSFLILLFFRIRKLAYEPTHVILYSTSSLNLDIDISEIRPTVMNYGIMDFIQYA
jgi:hypothetical protein